MIPIKYTGIEKDTVAQLCSELLGNCRPKKIEEINEWCLENIIIRGKKKGFREIIEADYPLLQKVARRIDWLKKRRVSLSSKQEQYLTKTLYGKHIDKVELVKKLDISVCPYCNRGFLNALNTYKTYQIDHFYPIENYPLLAVSFYNLVPCCYACNHKKLDKLISYSPHDPSYKSADELIHFDFWPSDTDYIRNEDSLHVIIDSDRIMEKNLRRLELKSLYEFHKKDIQETIQRAIIYPEETVDDFMIIYKDLFKSRNEAERAIWGFSIGDKYYRHQMLSKLKSDIYFGLL